MTASACDYSSTTVATDAGVSTSTTNADFGDAVAAGDAATDASIHDASVSDAASDAGVSDAASDASVSDASGDAGVSDAAPDSGVEVDPTLLGVLGTYRRFPTQNDWHTGRIEITSTGLAWNNDASVTWTLDADLPNHVLHTGPDCPYFTAPNGNAFTLEYRGTEIVGFRFQGELYTRIGAAYDAIFHAYQRLPVQNAWHTGHIQEAANGPIWMNSANVSWTLVPDLANGVLLTTSDCPYYTAPNGNAFTLVYSNQAITGFDFQAELYSVIPGQ